MPTSTASFLIRLNYKEQEIKKVDGRDPTIPSTLHQFGLAWNLINQFDFYCCVDLNYIFLAQAGALGLS